MVLKAESLQADPLVRGAEFQLELFYNELLLRQTRDGGGERFELQGFFLVTSLFVEFLDTS